MPAPSLSDLVAPRHSAVLLQELQNGVVTTGGHFPAIADAVAEIGVIEHAATVAAAARRVGVPVIHATAENLPDDFGVNRNARLFGGARSAGAENRPGTDAVAPVADLVGDGDVILPRHHGLSPLAAGVVDGLLRNRGVTTLIVLGVSLNVAIPNVVFDAVNMSYQVVLVTDGVAGVPVEYGESVVRNSLSLLATLATSVELVEAWSEAT